MFPLGFFHFHKLSWVFLNKLLFITWSFAVHQWNHFSPRPLRDLSLYLWTISLSCSYFFLLFRYILMTMLTCIGFWHYRVIKLIYFFCDLQHLRIYFLYSFNRKTLSEGCQYLKTYFFRMFV